MKKLRTLALGLVLALSLTACGGAKTEQAPASQTKAPAAEAPKNHLEEIKAAGKIVLGTSADYPPYEFHKLENGKDTIVGWEIELAEAIAKELGVKLEIKDSKFDTLLGDLNAKKLDWVIAGLTITEERKKSVDFSDPYVKGGQVLLTRKDTGIKGVADLNGKTIGVQLGTVGETEAKKIQGAKVKSLDSYEAVVLDLISGKVDAVVIGNSVGKHYEKQNPKLAVVAELTSDETAAAFRKGDKELVEAVNKILAKLKQDGTIDKLIEKYQAEEKK